MEQRERELNQNKNFSEIKMLEITEKLCRIWSEMNLNYIDFTATFALAW